MKILFWETLRLMIQCAPIEEGESSAERRRTKSEVPRPAGNSVVVVTARAARTPAAEPQDPELPLPTKEEANSKNNTTLASSNDCGGITTEPKHLLADNLLKQSMEWTNFGFDDR